jgi:hypothetical protein
MDPQMRSTTLAVLLVGLLLVVPVLRGADTLPASLNDQEFWKLVTDFSEPGGSFAFEMFMSNEVTFQTILPDLMKRVEPGGVYLGVGPEQNFTYIAALRPKMAFIVDIRRENLVELLMYKALFETSPTRPEFLSKLFSLPLASKPSVEATVEQLFGALSRQAADPQLLARTVASIKDNLQKTHGYALTPSDLQTIDYIANLFARYGPDAHLTQFGTTYRELMRVTDEQGNNRNFLTSDANYQFVRDMQKKNLIVPIVGDFAGPKALRAIAQYVKDRGAQVTTFYVSNVEEYIQAPPATWSAYCRNVAALPVTSSSTFVRFGRAIGSYLDPMMPSNLVCPGQ